MISLSRHAGISYQSGVTGLITGMKNLFKNIVWVIVILVLVSAGYSLIAGEFSHKDELSLSDLVKKINAGEVKKIDVVDSGLDITGRDGHEYQAQKEAESGLTETLKNYGVDTEKLKAVEVKVKNRNTP